MSLHLLPYFVYTNIKTLTRLCRCTGSSEPSLLAGVKLISKIMIQDFLQSKSKKKTFSIKCYLLYTRRRRVGVRTLCISPNIISSWNTFCDLGSNCLLKLLHQFYKIGTSLDIIESDQTLYDATPGLCLQSSPSLTNCKPRERQRNAELHALIPVTDVKWFGSRSAQCLVSDLVQTVCTWQDPPARTG